MEVVAYTDINPGEEVTLSYLPLNLISDQRQETLHHNWGFRCTCSLCTDAKATDISDRQRARLAKILQDINDIQPGHLLDEGFKNTIVEIEELVEREGLTAQSGDLYGLISDTWLGIGNAGMAREFAGNAVKVQGNFAGVDNERTLRALERLEGTGA